VQSDHAAVDLLIEGLDSIVADTREDARETLDFIFNESFASAGQAKAWWQANKNRYDRDLVEQDE
jgi:hypothetical protein